MDGHQAGKEEHYVQDVSVICKDQERKQGYGINSRGELLVIECPEADRSERKRHYVEPALRRCPYKQHWDGRRKAEKREDKIQLVLLLEQSRPYNGYCQKEEKYQRKAKDYVPKPHRYARAAVTHVGFVFPLIGIQHLGYLRRYYLSVGYQEGSGRYVTLGLGNLFLVLRLQQVRCLLVIDQVWNYQFQDSKPAEKGINVKVGILCHNIRLELCPGVGLLVYL